MAEIAVVGHDKDPVGAARFVLAADIVERIEDDRIGGPPARMTDAHASRDPLVPETRIGGAIEDDLDRKSVV